MDDNPTVSLLYPRLRNSSHMGCFFMFVQWKEHNFYVRSFYKWCSLSLEWSSQSCISQNNTFLWMLYIQNKGTQNIC